MTKKTFTVLGIQFWPCTSQAILMFLLVYAVGLALVLGLSKTRNYLSPTVVHPRDLQYNTSTTITVAGPKPKVILYWNKFFRAADFRFGYGQEPFILNGCQVTSCMTTTDRSLIDKADAVMIHGPVVDPPPPRPRPGQKYVYVQGEPHYDISEDLLHILHGYVNITMTYRMDSDIRLPYGTIKQHPEARIRRRKPRMRVDPTERPRSVVWVVSHCDTPSRREEYVKELRKYIDVDIYGSCGKKSCPKKQNPECREMYEKRYSFMLAFENDFCKDYASEKLFHPLRYDIVPIVFGGVNLTNDVPPHSAINVLDYPNPKNLAKYLKFLITHKHEYNEYLAWKEDHYDIEVDRRTIMAGAMCRLCELLNDPHYRYKDYADIKRWWVHRTCDRKIMDKVKKSW